MAGQTVPVLEKSLGVTPLLVMEHCELSPMLFAGENPSLLDPSEFIEIVVVGPDPPFLVAVA